MRTRNGIFISLIPVLFITQLVNTFSSHSFVGKYFSDFEIKKVHAKDWIGCLNSCFEDPNCISYNFHRTSKLCWLNEHGVEDFKHPDRQLLDQIGWIFHQIRPVTMTTNKVHQKGLCSCNCGSADQCYHIPGIGEVPEKAELSCSHILKKRAGQAPDGPYYLKTSDEVFQHKVYCQMTPIPACETDSDKGGWTLVLKIDGSKNTFHYDADMWDSDGRPAIYHQEEFGGDLEERETKLKTYKSIHLTEICLGMKTPNSTIKWIKITVKDISTQMLTIIKNVAIPLPKYIFPEKGKWEEIVGGAKLDQTATEIGFNQLQFHGAHARIGVIGSESYIGLGTKGPGIMGNITCGFVNKESNLIIPTFGYIMVR